MRKNITTENGVRITTSMMSDKRMTVPGRYHCRRNSFRTKIVMRPVVKTMRRGVSGDEKRNRGGNVTEGPPGFFYNNLPSFYPPAPVFAEQRLMKGAAG